MIVCLFIHRTPSKTSYVSTVDDGVAYYGPAVPTWETERSALDVLASAVEHGLDVTNNPLWSTTPPESDEVGGSSVCTKFNGDCDGPCYGEDPEYGPFDGGFSEEDF